MIVVDTNIAVYLFLDSYATEMAATLLRLDEDWHTEQFLLVELVNVIARNVRAGRLDRKSGEVALEQITSFFRVSLHEVSNLAVLDLALDLGVSAYDARYVALAQSLGVRLVTEDRKLRAAAPTLTESLDEAIARLQQ